MKKFYKTVRLLQTGLDCGSPMNTLVGCKHQAAEANTRSNRTIGLLANRLPTSAQYRREEQ